MGWLHDRQTDLPSLKCSKICPKGVRVWRQCSGSSDSHLQWINNHVFGLPVSEFIFPWLDATILWTFWLNRSWRCLSILYKVLFMTMQEVFFPLVSVIGITDFYFRKLWIHCFDTINLRVQLVALLVINSFHNSDIYNLLCTIFDYSILSFSTYLSFGLFPSFFYSQFFSMAYRSI